MVVYKSDIKRRYRGVRERPSQASTSSQPKRAKVHAQRKFAQGLTGTSSVADKSYVKEKEKVKSNGKTDLKPNSLPVDRPKTEDFLTFLCFRGTSALPQRLDFFNVAGSDNSDGANQGLSNHSSDILKSKNDKLRSKHSAVKIHCNKFKDKTRLGSSGTNNATIKSTSASRLNITRRSGRLISRKEVIVSRVGRRKQVVTSAKANLNKRIINSQLQKRIVAEKRERGGLRSGAALPSNNKIIQRRRPRSSSNNTSCSNQTVQTYPVRKSAIPLGDTSDDDEDEEEEDEEEPVEEEKPKLPPGRPSKVSKGSPVVKTKTDSSAGKPNVSSKGSRGSSVARGTSAARETSVSRANTDTRTSSTTRVNRDIRANSVARASSTAKANRDVRANSVARANSTGKTNSTVRGSSNTKSSVTRAGSVARAASVARPSRNNSVANKDIKEDIVTRTRSNSLRSNQPSPSPSNSLKRMPSRKTKEAAVAYMELFSKTLTNPDPESDSYDEQQDPALIEKAEKLASRRRMIEAKKVIPKKVLSGRSLKDRSLKRAPLISTQRKIVAKTLHTRRVEELVKRRTRGMDQIKEAPVVRPRRSVYKNIREATDDESEEEKSEEDEREDVEKEEVVSKKKNPVKKEVPEHIEEQNTSRRSRRSMKDEILDQKEIAGQEKIKKSSTVPSSNKSPESGRRGRSSKADKEIMSKSSPDRTNSKKVDSEMEVDESPVRQKGRPPSKKDEVTVTKNTTMKEDDKDSSVKKKVGRKIVEENKDVKPVVKKKSDEDDNLSFVRSTRKNSINDKDDISKDKPKKLDDNGKDKNIKSKVEDAMTEKKPRNNKEQVQDIKRKDEDGEKRLSRSASTPQNKDKKTIKEEIDNSSPVNESKSMRNTRNKSIISLVDIDNKEEETKASKKLSAVDKNEILSEEKPKTKSKLSKELNINKQPTNLPEKDEKLKVDGKSKPGARKKSMNVSQSDEEIIKETPKKKLKQNESEDVTKNKKNVEKSKLDNTKKDETESLLYREGSMDKLEEKELKGFDEDNAKEMESKVDKFIEQMILKTSDDESKSKMRSKFSSLSRKNSTDCIEKVVEIKKGNGVADKVIKKSKKKSVASDKSEEDKPVRKNPRKSGSPGKKETSSIKSEEKKESKSADITASRRTSASSRISTDTSVSECKVVLENIDVVNKTVKKSEEEIKSVNSKRLRGRLSTQAKKYVKSESSESDDEEPLSKHLVKGKKKVHLPVEAKLRPKRGTRELKHLDTTEVPLRASRARIAKHSSSSFYYETDSSSHFSSSEEEEVIVKKPDKKLEPRKKISDNISKEKEDKELSKSSQNEICDVFTIPSPSEEKKSVDIPEDLIDFKSDFIENEPLSSKNREEVLSSEDVRSFVKDIKANLIELPSASTSISITQRPMPQDRVKPVIPEYRLNESRIYDEGCGSMELLASVAEDISKMNSASITISKINSPPGNRTSPVRSSGASPARHSAMSPVRDILSNRNSGMSPNRHLEMSPNRRPDGSAHRHSSMSPNRHSVVSQTKHSGVSPGRHSAMSPARHSDLSPVRHSSMSPMKHPSSNISSVSINKISSSSLTFPKSSSTMTTSHIGLKINPSLPGQTGMAPTHLISPRVNPALVQPRGGSSHLVQPKVNPSLGSSLIIPKVNQPLSRSSVSVSQYSLPNSSQVVSKDTSPLSQPTRSLSSSELQKNNPVSSLTVSSSKDSPTSVKPDVSSSASDSKVNVTSTSEQTKPTSSSTESSSDIKPKPITSSIGETWIQAFKKAKIPKPGQLSPISHSVKPFVRKPFINQPFVSKQQSPLKCDTADTKFKPFDRSSLIKSKAKDSTTSNELANPKQPVSLVKPVPGTVTPSVSIAPSQQIPNVEIKKEPNIDTIINSSLSKTPGAKIMQESFRPVEVVKTEDAKTHRPLQAPRVSDSPRRVEMTRETSGGKHHNLPLAIAEHTLRKMSPVAVSRKPATSSVSLKPQISTSHQEPKEINIFDQSKSNRSSPASSKSSWLWKPEKYLGDSMVTKPSDLEIMAKKKVNMTVEEIEKWLDDSTSTGIEHSKDCGLFEKNQCECGFRTSGSSMQNSGTALNELSKVGRSIVEPPMQLKDIEPKCTAETISTHKVEEYKEKLISKTPTPLVKENKVEVRKDLSKHKQSTPSKQEKWKSTRSMTEEEMCEFDFRFERNSNSPRESGSEMSSPTPKDEISSIDEGLGSQSERKSIFQKKNRNLSKSPCAFNAENESSVYAFEPEVEQPMGRPLFRRKSGKPGDGPAGSSGATDEAGARNATSIAVQVNLEQESVLECSTQTDHEEPAPPAGTTFYFPLRGKSVEEREQMIQGLTVKLDADPDGQEHRVTLRAKFKPAVTSADASTSSSSSSFTRPTSQSKCMTGRGKSGKPEQKVRPLSVNETPVGTVVPTLRPPLPLDGSTSQESFTTTVSVSSKSSQSTQFSQIKPRDNKATSPLQTQSSKSNDLSIDSSSSSKVEEASTSSSHKPAGKRGGSRNLVNSGRSSHLTGFPKSGDKAKLVVAPSFYPTEKEFSDPMEYLAKITPLAEQYGICRIVPPSSFKPECKVSDDMRFTSFNHYIHKMMRRWGPNVKELTAIKKYLATQSIAFKQPPWIGGMEVDLARLYQTVQQCGGLKEVIEKKRWTRVADLMKIPKSAQDRITKLDDIYCKYLLPYDTLNPEERKNLLRQVEEDWEEKERKIIEGDSASSIENSDDEDSEDETFSDEGLFECITKGRSMALSQFYRIARNTLWMWFGSESAPPKANEVEHEYWNQVQTRQCHICVHSGSIDCGTHGYGFPTAKTSNTSKHPWNLKVLANHQQSVLRSLPSLMGVTVPTLNVGMLFSSCCWYRDPHGLPWIEYLHTGANKIWYGVPDEWTNELKGAVKSVIPSIVRESPIWLPSDTAMIPPDILLEKGVSLCRIVQEPGQFIIIFPKAYTSAICTGYLVSENVYYAPNSWLATAPQLFKETEESCEQTDFSLEKLLFFIASDTRSSLDILVQICPMVENVREKEVKERKELLKLGLNTSEKLPKPKRSSAAQEELVCNNCRKTLFLSMVNDTEEDINYCLSDALEILTKDLAQLKNFKLLYLYDEEEMEELVEKLKTKIDVKSQKKAAKGSSNAGGSSNKT